MLIKAEPSKETWPTEGSIQFKDVSLKYKEDHALAIKDITFTIAGGQKIGK